MTVQVWVDGRPLDTVAPWGGLTFTSELAGGCLDASWRMEVRRGWDHSVLVRGTVAEIRLGGTPLWAGVLAEPNRDTWEVYARGVAAEANRFLALAADGSMGRYVGTVTQLAIARGLPWVSHEFRGGPFPGHANPVRTDDDGEGLNTVHALWEAAADAAGWFWGVGPDRRPYVQGRPVVPKWRAHVPPDSLGLADDEYVTHLVGRFRSVPGAYATVSVGNGAAAAKWGRRELDVDLTERGIMPQAQAVDILSGMLAKLLPRPGYANGLDFGEWDVTTLGGRRANPLLIQPGDMIRLHGVRDDGLTSAAYHDVVAGRVKYEAPRRGGSSVHVEPLGLAARNFQAVLEGTDTPARLVA